MLNTTHFSPLAITYAQALLELANDRRLAEDVGRELEGLGEILQSEPVFRDYLADPGVSQDERAGALQRIFQGRVSELVYNFLGVMNTHGRLRLLDQVLAAYAQLLDEQLGNVEVEVTTAQPLSSEQVEQVRTRVGQAIGKNAILTQKVNDDIIGGMVIRVDDQVIDASVKEQLRAVRQQLHTAAQKVGK